MPFRSEAQRRYLYSQKPRLAREFEEATPKGKKLPQRVGKMSDVAATERSIRKMVARASKFFDVNEKQVNEFHAEFSKLYGKSKGPFPSNTGPSPAPYDPIPDYAEIYYQPEGDSRREDESENTANRRRSMAEANRGKYGFHGTAEVSNEPQLRYDEDDFPRMERRTDGMKHFKPNVAGAYTQPLDDEDEDGEEQSHRVQPSAAPAPNTRGPDQMKKQRFVIGKRSGKMGAGTFSDSNTPQERMKQTANETNAPATAKKPRLASESRAVHQRPTIERPKKPIEDSFKRMGT